ncbi:MAG: AAA family ATPase [Hungatella sp.]
MRQLPENEITDISFAEGSLNDVILFLKESYGNHADKIDATRLSDGTLRCLAILAALWSEDEHGILVIEEVDNGIHPGRAKKLMETISSVAKKRNLDVLITTHNATMLNALSREDLQGGMLCIGSRKMGQVHLFHW